MITATKKLLERLQGHDPDAWLELWEVFGSSIERMVQSIARGCFSHETLKDIRQETLLEVFRNIASFDPGRGVKLSTWLYSIARHIVASELTYRGAQKRNRGQRPLSLEETSEIGASRPGPDDELEASVFRAKVYRAIRLVERECDFLEFQVYRLRLAGKLRSSEIAAGLGISEATVCRYIQKVREKLRGKLIEVVEEYSATPEELDALRQSGLGTEREDFDAAVGDIYAAVEQDRALHAGLARSARRVSEGSR